MSPEGAMKIVFVSAEIAPWSITGGLGAVCDGLPRAMAKAGHRVMSIAPRYDQYFDAWDTEFEATVNLGESTTKVRFFHCFKKGVDRVFVDHPLFLEKVWGLSKQKIYGPKWGKDYEDNQLRFAMFCDAALTATKHLSLGGTPYGEDVVFVANDWHAALVPMYIKEAKAKGEWGSAKTVALLHNMVFQGRFPADTSAAARLHLSQETVDSMSVKQTLKIGLQKKQIKGLKSKEEIPNPSVPVLNFLMGSIKSADLCLTVSPNYAKEVVLDPIKGAELEGALTERGIKGILNGVEDIVRPDNAELGLGENAYDKTSLEKKRALKMAMQKSLNLTVDGDIPLFVFLGRLDAQKGVDIMFEAIAKALDSGIKAQFITMGSGIEELEEVASDLDDRFPGKFKAVLSFKGQEKYRTYAAADFALMPSRYEPCGLVQMEGMRFGCLPIVTPTGGLYDTVLDMKTGLVMEHEVDQDGLEEVDVQMLVGNIERAMGLIKAPAKLREMQVAAMEAATDFSWSNSVKQYVAEFKRIGVKTM
jgi:granule-bound starch synthase